MRPKSEHQQQRAGKRRRVGKLHGEQAQIHIPVGKHKWRALRELKKARLEAGLYQEVREERQSGAGKSTDLLKLARKQSSKVSTSFLVQPTSLVVFCIKLCSKSLPF